MEQTAELSPSPHTISPPPDMVSKPAPHEEHTHEEDQTHSQPPEAQRTMQSYADIKDDIYRFMARRERTDAERKLHKEMLSAEMRTVLGEMPRATLPTPISRVLRGLQAFDLARNPQIEKLPLPVRCSHMGKPRPSSITIDGRFSHSVKSQLSEEDGLVRLQSQADGKIENVSSIPGHSCCKLPFQSKRRLVLPPITRPENFRDEAPIEVPWLNERLATSCRSCRFEMPMDMLEMEKMTIQEYLLKYCRIARHRQILYKKLYERKANKNTGLLSFKELEASLCSVLVNSVDAQDIRRLFTALDLKKDSTVDLQLFMVICALAERILYISYTGRLGRAGVSRGFLESADFCALEWKLRGVNINPALKRLLLSLG